MRISNMKTAIRKAENDYLFGGKGEGGIMSSRGVSEQLRRFADKYDIPREVMHPHSFRHRFAINFLQENKDIALLADHGPLRRQHHHDLPAAIQRRAKTGD